MTTRWVSREDVVGVIGFEVERVVAKLLRAPGNHSKGVTH
jgi:hypothetical protein